MPTGALRRTLSLTLHDVEAPDRLWAIIRGVEPSAPLGSGDRPLAQRLDVGERVLWSAAPARGDVDDEARRSTAASGAVLALLFERSLASSVPVARAAAPDARPVAGARGRCSSAPWRSACCCCSRSRRAPGTRRSSGPSRLNRRTRYFVTNARVLIRRGNEELALDRSRIAYVIDAPSRKLHDVFLVLDGPQARALAPSGAFGGDGADDVLRPVFSAIDDADTVGRILRA